jgi:prepilin-type N-terminal cleavage/methylation domain-containing protein
MTTRTSHADRRGAGFTLIEVLIGVLVLAIGLLGLGGMISVVVRQQVSVVEARRCESARRSVELFFDAASGVIDWEHLREDYYMSIVGTEPPCDQTFCVPQAPLPNPPTPLYGRWEVDWAWFGRDPQYVTNYRTQAVVHVGGGVGRRCFCLVPNPINPNQCDVCTNERPPVEQTLGRAASVLNVGTRLVPQAFSGATPEFVWDFYPRRREVAPTDDYRSAGIEVAVFLRRIDPGIRLAPGQTLDEALTSTGPDRVLPVAVDASGIPTRNGRGSYAHARAMTINVVPPPAGQMQTRVDMGGDATLQYLAGQPGQKLVDVLGLVQTVVDRDPRSPQTLIIEPGYDRNQALRVNGTEVIFTPQVPCAVFVRQIR